MRKVAKSGWPVIGQTQVNSGTVNWISRSRSGEGLGKVCSDLFGRVVMAGSGGGHVDPVDEEPRAGEARPLEPLARDRDDAAQQLEGVAADQHLGDGAADGAF